ncbi:MAG: glycosyltransferase [Muribaculaceae bacterium]|nr:glycosyltransferase [Muribaculaceae bacterium]
MPEFSVIVPVYNRINEVDELLQSLASQTFKDFEVMIVEDGSTDPCGKTVEKYSDKISVRYFFKENEGRSIARNHGMKNATGNFFIFFDSDCVIPPDYFEKLSRYLKENPTDCFGGPDAAHESFSNTQKAINYSMTSFLTTGGIRGGKVSLEKFVPRTFNMGFSRNVWEKVGGFREMFSEDIDMSTRIKQSGFSISLFPELYVWHKRRIDFRKFLRQVYVFGMSRITLQLLYPGSMKAVHLLPALFLTGCVVEVLLAIFLSPWWLLPLGVYLMAIMITAWISTGSLIIALKAVPASIIQLWGYGAGFIKAYFQKIILRQGRNVSQEIEMRRGK